MCDYPEVSVARQGERCKEFGSQSRCVDLLQRCESAHELVSQLVSMPFVHIKDAMCVAKTLDVMRSGGATKLQSIMDFDYTVSRHSLENGTKLHSSYNVLDHSDLVSEDIRNAASAMKEKYYAIEIDPHMSHGDKLPYMLEWWQTARSLLVTTNLHRDNIPDYVKQSDACLRENCASMITSLHKADVPLLIFSAGIGDVLEEILRQQDGLLPNVTILSNYMKFNEETGILEGFVGDMIHSFNKNSHIISNQELLEKLRERPNVVLAGDMISDASMAAGLDNIENILKIGFLNDPSAPKAQLDLYTDAFDIVLVSDSTMNILRAIFAFIVGTAM